MKNKLISTITFSLFALISIESAIALDDGTVEIGNSYRCSGTSILNSKGKTVKLATAKTSIQNKIDDVVGSSAKAKAKRSALKTTKSNLTKCSKGQLTSDNPGGGGSGGDGPGDNSAVLGKYTGTLTRISINDKTGGCADSATPTWTFKILVSPTSGETYVSASSPFLGAYKGGATTSGFKFIQSSLSLLRGADTQTLIGSNVTDTSATITITEKHERIVPIRPKGYDKVLSCEATYTGEVTREKDAQN